MYHLNALFHYYYHTITQFCITISKNTMQSCLHNRQSLTCWRVSRTICRLVFRVASLCSYRDRLSGTTAIRLKRMSWYGSLHTEDMIYSQYRRRKCLGCYMFKTLGNGWGGHMNDMITKELSYFSTDVSLPALMYILGQYRLPSLSYKSRVFQINILREDSQLLQILFRILKIKHTNSKNYDLMLPS